MKGCLIFPAIALSLCLSHRLSAQSYIADLLPQKVTVHYPDHTITAEVKPTKKPSTSGKFNYYWFSGNQINITQGGYSGKLLNGLYQDFYLNKNLRETGWLTRGLKSKVWKNWNEHGQLIAQYAYRHGQKNGAYLKYDSLGRISEKGKYRNELLHGTQQLIQTDTILILHYKKGKQVQRKSILPGSIRKLFVGKTK